MTDDEMVEALNARRPPAVRTLGGRVVAFDAEARCIEMCWLARPEFCHSEVIVQGGFITGMLDSAMSQVVIGVCGIGTAVPTLELKVSFIAPGNPGELRARARIVHLGRSTAFLAGELHQEDRLVATSSATAKVIRPS